VSHRLGKASRLFFFRAFFQGATLAPYSVELVRKRRGEKSNKVKEDPEKQKQAQSLHH